MLARFSVALSLAGSVAAAVGMVCVETSNVSPLT